MMEFSRIDFSKSISLTSKQQAFELKTKWDSERLGDVIDVKIGGTPSRSNSNYFTGDNLWVSISEMKGQVITDTKEKITEQGIKDSNVKLIPKGTTLLSFKLSIGKTAVAGKDLYTNEAIAGLIPKDKKQVLSPYIFHLFNAKLIDLENVGLNTFGKSLNSGYLKSEVKIPLPPPEVQQQIVVSCSLIDKEGEKAEKEIEKGYDIIEKLITDFSNQGYPTKKVSNLSEVNPSKSEVREVDENTVVSFIEMASVSEEGFISHKEDRLLKDVKSGSYRYFKEKDIIIAKITPCMENGKCAIATGLTNQIGFGSSEFHVFRVDEALTTNKFLFAFLNREVIRKEAEQNMTGSSGHRRVPDTFYKNLQIPVPTDKKNQTELISNIEKAEKKIKASQDIIDGVTKRKETVIKSYLMGEVTEPELAIAAEPKVDYKKK
ncbi:MAG: hypothetical protein GKR88_18445 [Flavobacteriaceae bacterium]|nr:MAG: hypothetical protein GKR88_18445 [Flavobacteriaceae bacterium]